MRVIARGTLYGFIDRRVPAPQRKAVKSQLDNWYVEVAGACWKNSAELKAHFRSASVINAERVVFNIKGNDYRLIVAIDYAHQFVLIKWLGTHKEYDTIDASEVAYEEARYDNPAR